MLDPKPRILAIDDEDSMLLTYKSILKNSYDLVLANNALSALEQFKTERFPLILLDIMMPDINGLEVLRKVRELDEQADVIMITGVNDLKCAISAMKLGAYDYITKPFDSDELLAVVSKVFERRDLIRENLYLRQVLAETGRYLNLVGKSPVMKKLYDLIDKVGPTDATVLISGQPGTGKELVARAIHKRSLRAGRAFVVVNCAAMPDSLMETELFGQEKGAFSDAYEAKPGKFELADGGTIFLDEIGCLKSSLQAKLLRVLEDGEITRVGGVKLVKVNVRIVVATNLDLELAVKNSNFRPDLYYRLNVMPIKVPALCERLDDLPFLLQHFVEKFNRELKKQVKGFSPEATALLQNYSWPGNVRELQNMVERLMVFSGGKTIFSVSDLPEEQLTGGEVKGDFQQAKEDFEKKLINKALTVAKGNQSQAAKSLGINRSTLLSKMRQLGL